MKIVKCKYGFCILKGIIMTGLVGTLATFVVLYINERNELNSVKDKMKMYGINIYCYTYIF